MLHQRLFDVSHFSNFYLIISFSFHLSVEISHLLLHVVYCLLNMFHAQFYVFHLHCTLERVSIHTNFLFQKYFYITQHTTLLSVMTRSGGSKCSLFLWLRYRLSPCSKVSEVWPSHNSCYSSVLVLGSLHFSALSLDRRYFSIFNFC